MASTIYSTVPAEELDIALFSSLLGGCKNRDVHSLRANNRSYNKKNSKWQKNYREGCQVMELISQRSCEISLCADTQLLKALNNLLRKLE